MATVINNETGKTKEFATMEAALAYQEYLVFVMGIDAEVL